METTRFSLAGKATAVFAGALVLLSATFFVFSLLPVAPWLAFLLASGTVLPLAAWGFNVLFRPLRGTAAALSDGIRSFRDRDFSVRIASARRDEFGELARLYNEVASILQEERSAIRQRELLLQTALDQSPIAILLVSPLERVVYANHEARRVFLGGRKLEGLHFNELLAHCPEEMQQVLASGVDGIFTVDAEPSDETYHVSQRGFFLNRRRHRLYLVRHMTQELGRQEAEIWKKVIRVISHELNNSLAPISSLTHSGQLIADLPNATDELRPIFSTIRERIDYLNRFIEGYARFARLPKPNKQSVEWSDWLGGPRELYGFQVQGQLPRKPGWFDPSQLQQVLINLLKNAAEASDGYPGVVVKIDELPDGGALVQVLDRGRGMRR